MGETFRCKAAKNFSHCNGSQTTSLLFGCQEGGTAEVRDDIWWAVASTQELDDTSERSGGMSCMVRRRALNSLLQVVGPEVRWARSGATWERLQGLEDTGLRDCGRRWGGPGGVRGAGDCGCFASMASTTSEVASARPTDERA